MNTSFGPMPAERRTLKTQREPDAERRRQELEDGRRQVDEGSLVIGPMTAEGRGRHVAAGRLSAAEHRGRQRAH
jgi:hypothetical protein